MLCMHKHIDIVFVANFTNQNDNVKTCDSIFDYTHSHTSCTGPYSTIRRENLHISCIVCIAYQYRFDIRIRNLIKLQIKLQTNAKTTNPFFTHSKMVKYSKSFHAICFTFSICYSFFFVYVLTSIHTNTCCVIRLQLLVFQCVFSFFSYTHKDTSAEK